MDLSNLKAHYDRVDSDKKYEEQLKHNKLDTLAVQETVWSVAKTLIEFLEGHTSKTVVLNQLKDFATSKDVSSLIQSIESVHSTLKTHENVDITPLTEVMKSVLDEAKQIPKSHPEKVKPKDYSKKLDQLSKAVGLVEKAIKAQETVVEQPDINLTPGS